MEIKPPFLNLSRNEQKLAVEVMLFASEEPLSLQFMFDILIANNASYYRIPENNNDSDEKQKNQITFSQEIMKRFDIFPEFFQELITEINLELFETGRPYQIVNIASGYQFATRSEYGELLNRLTKTKPKRKFSQAALETLSIIAYKQPVSKPEIEQIRGVNSNELVNSLLEKKFISIAGRKDALGKPLLYSTSNFFLKTFGLKNLDDLPKLREIEEIASDDVLINSHIELTLDIDDTENADKLQSEIDKEYGLTQQEETDILVEENNETIRNSIEISEEAIDLHDLSHNELISIETDNALNRASESIPYGHHDNQNKNSDDETEESNIRNHDFVITEKEALKEIQKLKSE